MLEIYSTGGGEYLETTLNALAAFFNTNNALALVNIGLLLGIFILVFQLVFAGDYRQAIKAYVLIALVGGLSIGDKSDVIIFDKTKGPLWFRTVDNVPTSVAYVGSFTSRISNVLTTEIETLFSPPTNIAYQRHGMLFGATLMTKTARWRAVTAAVHENVTNFLDQCVIDAVELRYLEPDIVTRSGNLEATISANMPASLAYYDTQTRSTRACSEGWPDLVAAINAEVNVVLAAQAASTFQGPDAAAAINDIRDTISDFASFAGYAATSAEAHIKQAMMIAAFDDAANRGISATGNAAALQHLQAARAEVQTRSSYQAVGSNALSWVPYLKIVFENLYYGAFPIALALMMTPLCFSVIRGYFGGFVWLASWEPLSAILHSLMMNATAERFQTITSASTSGAYTDSIMNWANHFGVYSIGQDVSVMAGYLMMSIPFVAAAIFMGTQRMVGLATSMLAVSQSAATETGREIATGNLAYGNASVGNRTFRNLSMDNYARNNASYDNVSGNRTVTSPFTDVGRSSSFARDGSMITTNADGTVGIDGGSSRVNTATSVGLGQSVVSTLRNQASSMMERGASARRSYERSVSETASQTSSFMQSIQNGSAFTSGRGINASAEDRSSLSESVNTLERFSQHHGVSNQTALQVGMHARAGVGWKGLSVGAKSSLERQGVTRESFDQMSEASRSQGMDSAISDLSRATQDYNSSETSSSNITGDKGTRDTIDDLGRQARSAETYRRASDSYSEAADSAESNFIDNRVDLSAPFADWMMDKKGMNPTQVAETLNGRSAPEQSSDLRSEFAQQYVNDLVGPEVAPVFGTEIPSPRDPGAAAPVGDVFDAKSTLYGPLANKQLETEMSIERGSRAISPVAPGAEALRAGTSDIVGRTQDAQANSWSNSVHNNTGGGLVPDGNRVEWRPSQASAPRAAPMSPSDRDIAIRTIAAEAGNEGRQGQAAVASVIRNRVADDRFANDVRSVLTAPGQFSAWNTDGTGNRIGHDLDSNSATYREIGNVVDDVFGGRAVDPTQGATHYYSPAGMQDYANKGYQSNTEPSWLPNVAAESGGTITIGNHVFAGRLRDEK